MANELLTTSAIIAKEIIVSLDSGTGTQKILGEVIEIGDISEPRQRIDVTPFSDAGTDTAYLYRKIIDGMYDEVLINITLNYPDATATFAYFSYNEINQLRISAVPVVREFNITYPDGAVFSFDGRIIQMTNRVALDAQIIFEIQIRVEGPITYTEA